MLYWVKKNIIQVQPFFQGEPGENVYFLRTGKIKVLKSNPSGEEQILEFFQSGDIFGEVILFGIKKYPATAVALEDVEVIYLPPEPE